MRDNFKLNALSAAVLGAMFSTPLYAQETIEQEAVNLEEVVVTGFAQSIEKAVDAKRLADTISDSIFAEDVGKSTDQNIADALSRVTGVSVTEESGEGARITVRGTSPSQNIISINGVELTGGLGGSGDDARSDNSVDLSSFSADILSSIDVVKTAAADQNEGSLGANIELNTLRPLSLNERRLIGSAEGRYNEYRGSSDYRISGSYADKFLDDSFGVVFTLTADKNSIREDRIQNAWEEGYYEIGDKTLSAGGANRTARDINGNEIRVGLAAENESEVSVAADGNGEYFGVLGKQGTYFSTSSNERERTTANLGLQYQPTDTTDIQLDFTYTKQKVTDQFISLNLGYGGASPQAEDQITPANSPTNFVTEWNTVDVENRTLLRSYGRGHQGSTNRFEGERDLTTNVVSLRVEQDLTDSLTMAFRAGYSKTEDELLDGKGITTATWGTVTVGDLPDASVDVDAVGYDCTAGTCSYNTGSSFATFDPAYAAVTDVNTRFNPYDLQANHVGNVTWRTNFQTDTNSNINLDFDWEVDKFYFTTLEFGAKYATREKDVQTQNENLDTGVVLIDRDSGDPAYVTQGMQNIKLGQFVDSAAFPYDDFLDGLDVDRNQAWVNGWPLADVDKAITLLSGQDPNTVGRSLRDDGTRNIATDTMAAYFKANFEFMDGRLTGNAGLRYVRDETEATGYGAASFARQNWMFDAQELFVERELANTSKGACPNEPWAFADENGNPVDGDDLNANGTKYFLFNPTNADSFNGCWDWRLTHAYVANNPDTYPVDANGNWRFLDVDGNPNYEVNRIFAMDYNGATPTVIQNDGLPASIYDPMGFDPNLWLSDRNLLPTVATNSEHFRHFNTQGLIYAYGDRTTSFTGPLGNDPIAQTRSASVYDSVTHNLLLPSLTLNFQINDDMIVRGAVSRTMTRPQADDLNPSLSITEQVWDPQDQAESGNTQLKLLTSDNFDLSYEWYFGDANMFSAGYFHKNIKNTPIQVYSFYHYESIRDQYDIEDLNVLIPHNNTDTALNSNCQVERSIGNFSADNDGWGLDCRDILVEGPVNADKATTDGLELGYTQMFDFMPGIWSNFGVQTNYTYQYSETSDVVTGDGRIIEPLPLPYTPQHSSNFTLFWENEKLELRLANRYNGVQLFADHAQGGIWKDATNRLDFSANYHITDKVSVSFNALNLTDETHRTYLVMNQARIGVDADGNDIFMSEDWGFNGDTYSGRTVGQWKNGRQFRLGLRAAF
ncbi:TonB-dependent receptor [Saccharophagus degradans]|uniref:TonB-dependent receptor domain-containing protein n=1 Tax=Saccharophagus degradans TaxID=86304 RepID=UPI001C099036|nr:TonB-dependent receptor [Saccharophagus degradans]MBU2986612.1 TonB-dependent receptor [Saccharophagus degradans]